MESFGSPFFLPKALRNAFEINEHWPIFAIKALHRSNVKENTTVKLIRMQAIKHKKKGKLESLPFF